MYKRIVAKFGGTSVADADQIRKVIAIVRGNPQRRHVVVSASGKRFSGDDKVTDLLYKLHPGVSESSRARIMEILVERFSGIVRGLELSFPLEAHLQEIERLSRCFNMTDHLVSRGECLTARIVAEALGFEFVDAADLIRFSAGGHVNEVVTVSHRELLLGDAAGYVIPGFYGSLPGGTIRTFPRGGSDITGAIVAELIGADLYENWTDVDGLRVTDPKLVPDARGVDVVTFDELAELAYGGAEVLHEDAIAPAQRAGIPILILNTNRPEENGTLIVPDLLSWPHRKKGSIIGIAGRSGFTDIILKKRRMNRELGFLEKVCGIFAHHQLNIEHLPGGLDSVSVVVRTAEAAGVLDCLLRELSSACDIGEITTHDDTALICTVGASMAHTPGVAAKLFGALASAGINVRMINQCSSEISIIVGVAERDYERAVRAIYDAFEQ